MSSSATTNAPTSRQLRYLKALAEQTGTSFSYPRSRGDAHREIDRLRALKAKGRARFQREPSIKTDPLVYATAAHPSEVSGYGSSAHWRTSPEVERETLPSKSSVGPLTELARYTVSSGERVLYGQRINGAVRITDRPASGAGRAYIVERGLEQDGYSALQTLVGDYIEQAHELDVIPIASSCVRRDLELMAEEA
jgi:hypothetical protein